jgi:hypothetical protein
VTDVSRNRRGGHEVQMMALNLDWEVAVCEWSWPDFTPM